MTKIVIASEGVSSEITVEDGEFYVIEQDGEMIELTFSQFVALHLAMGNLITKQAE